MKIIILTYYYDRMPPLSLEYCKNKFQLHAYSIYKYITSNTNNEVCFNKLPPKGISLIHNYYINTYKLDNADHVIIVDEGSLYSRTSKLKNKLREFIKGAIVSVDSSNVYYGGEDMLFFMDTCSGSRKNTKCINWLCDGEELYSDKNENTIKILIQKPNNNINKRLDVYNKILTNIIQFKEANKGQIDVEIGNLSNNHYENLSTNEIIPIDNYEKKYNILRNTDIYFIISNAFDRELIYELGLCNVLFITNKNLINNKIINNFDFIFYENLSISWREIINRLNKVRSRYKLINSGFDCATGINKILKYLESYELKDTFKDTFKDTSKIKKTNDKLTSNINEPSIKTKSVERHSGSRMIQSKLRLK